MLPIAHRLKGKKAFSDLFRFGKTFSSDVLIMKVGTGETGQPTKFGFGASLKFSKKAVERNKAKRWMREAVQANIENMHSEKQVVFFINPNFPKKELNLELIQLNIVKLLKQAKIL